MVDTVKDIHDKLNKYFPSSNDKCQLLCTLLGTSAHLTNFVVEKIPIHEIPLNIQYCLMITSVNMMAFFSDESYFEKINLEDMNNCKVSEQLQESIYRKMKKALDLIIEDFKNREEEDVI